MLTVACTTPVVPSKGHDVALRALALLLPEFSELTYHIVGGGDGEESLRTLAADLGVTDAVRFHGVIDDRSLSRLYENSSVFVMPSSSEGFGFAFLEAMARGTPAVGGNQDATPEVVLHGVTGFVVDPRSPREVADAVAAILRDEALRHRMSEAAVERAYSQFSFDEFQRRLLSILRGTGSSHSVLPAGTRAEGRSRETSLGDTGRAADG
jgi:phosphatidylinositol alpha-1,6-mannosyltransferase